MSPADHFPGHIVEYSGDRPTHLDMLFERRIALVWSRRLAWDCGTGAVGNV
ncbi:MAG: hypothetical protein ACE5H7_11795 [Acidiferrobacterales bacterium]